MIVVDVDLAQRSGDGTLEEPIEDVLKDWYGDKCIGKPPLSEGCPPPLILVASLRPYKKGLLEKRPSKLDGLVNDSKHIFWASPLFDQDWDQVIRRWRIWEPVWLNKVDDRPTAMPSIQLLAATLLTSGEKEINELQKCLKPLVLKGYNTMAGQPVSNDEKPCTVTLWEKEVDQRVADVKPFLGPVRTTNPLFHPMASGGVLRYDDSDCEDNRKSGAASAYADFCPQSVQQTRGARQRSSRACGFHWRKFP